MTVSTSVRVLAEVGTGDQLWGPENGDNTFEYYPTWRVKDVYVCPRGILVHRGRPGMCGRACDNARGETTEYEQEHVLHVIRIERKPTFNFDLCFAWNPEEADERAEI